MAPVIREITLTNFRSYARARVVFGERPALVLIGANGAGKTNLLEALSLLSPGRGLRRTAAGEMARTAGSGGWRIEAMLASPTGLREIAMTSPDGGPRALRLDGKAAAQTALSRLCLILWLTPAMDRLWIESAEGRRRFLDRMAMSFSPDHGEAALSYEKAMRERNRLLREDARAPAWFDALEARMARAGARLAHGRRLALERIAAATAATETAFPAADLSLSHPEAPLPDDAGALAGGLADWRGRDRAAGRTLIGPHRVDLEVSFAAKGMPARLASTGEQKALLISLVLANARALAGDGGAPPVLLLDEIAAHLDAGRRRALYQELAALGVQVVMTGTSPALFDGPPGWARTLRVREGANGSTIEEVHDGNE